MTGEKADRTNKTVMAYKTAKITLPNGTKKEMRDVLEDLISGSADDWGIFRPIMGTDSKSSDVVECVSLVEQNNKDIPSLPELKIRFLNAVMYNLMRKEGGRKK